MLDSVNLQKVLVKEEYKPMAAKLKQQLSVLQQSVKQNALPVVVLFEGWSAAGKGSKIGDIILNLDPRGFKVYSTVSPTEEEKRYPYLWRFWSKTPRQGDISIFDRSWYQGVSVEKIEQQLDSETVAARIKSILTFERQLVDDGCLVLKFFLHISKKEQKKRLEDLREQKSTRWRATDRDWYQNKHYDDYYRVFDEMLEATSTSYAPWHAIGCNDRNAALAEIYQILIKQITAAIAKKQALQKDPPPVGPIAIDPKFRLVQVPRLEEVDLDKTIDPDKYKVVLKEEQRKLKKLHNQLYAKKRPVVVVYEGWDTAGKGGNIRRVAAALDPRGFEVVPIAAPDKTELSHHYLWRFWTRLPKDGHVGIFDRSWYGRLMVERVEGFCTPADWHRAYNEINEFERELYDWGAVVVKFWVHIDKDEQLRRFNDRQNTPEKQWKITDEDWRNREKWDQHQIAVNDMLRYTSTDFAPWNIIESNDKKFARIKAIKTLIAAIEARL